MIANDKNQNVFINGKEKVIEMLRLLTQEERARILKNLEQKNPNLALELSQESQSFDSLESLTDLELEHLTQFIPAAILGLSIKGSTIKFQRRILSLAPRSYAEKAYEVFASPVANKTENVDRAQKKVLEILAKLKKDHKL